VFIHVEKFNFTYLHIKISWKVTARWQKHLANMNDALDSIPSTRKGKKERKIYPIRKTVTVITWAGGLGSREN
jgi:hypothetical protein